MILRRPLVLVLPALFVLLSACGQADLLIATGQPAPAFALERLDGKTLRFPQDFAGRVVALRFWADWCPYCKGEMNDIEPVYRDFRGRGLVVLAVNVAQTPKQIRAFLADMDISSEVLLDRDGGVSRSYGVMGLPVTYFVDRKGVVRTRIVGESTSAVFRRVAEELLAQR